MINRALPLLMIPLLAACTATPAAGPTPSQGNELAAFRALAQCYRAHGVPNFPDPVVDAQGEIKIDFPAQVPAAAKTACRSIEEGLPARAGQKPLTAEEVAALRKLAQCFRDHGVADWPDPDAAGTFHVNQRIQELGKQAWLPARDACKQYFVAKGLRMTGPSDQGGGK
ncbi:hypothetical protein ACIBG8_04970 [Nonomuraea sp. NPDC050556]|uniref:hypothetical protein n=1 Tax=Nonomuraea sp. NPDC050556 TaxID=3364369 RepID=UPI003796E52B